MERASVILAAQCEIQEADVEEVSDADLARRPPERAQEAQARLWSSSAVIWGRYGARWEGTVDENGDGNAWH